MRCSPCSTRRLPRRSGPLRYSVFITKITVLIVPLLVKQHLGCGDCQRQMVFKLMLALTISLTVSWAIGHLYPHDRPFVAGVGYNFLHHAADDSFPSDHGTVSFTFALAFCSGIACGPAPC